MEKAAVAVAQDNSDEQGGRTAMECLIKVKDDEGNPVDR